MSPSRYVANDVAEADLDGEIATSRHVAVGPDGADVVW